MFHVKEENRIRTGYQASDERAGNNGAFRIHHKGYTLHVIASNGRGWEHISVSIVGVSRCPSWEQMCFIKSLFWDEDDTVIQYHPAKAEYINSHPYVLHLWRPTEAELPKPLPTMIGLSADTHPALVKVMVYIRHYGTCKMSGIVVRQIWPSRYECFEDPDEPIKKFCTDNLLTYEWIDNGLNLLFKAEQEQAA